MASVKSAVMTLADIMHGMEAISYAILAKKEIKETAGGRMIIAVFKDRTCSLKAPIYSSNALLEDAHDWDELDVFRIEVVGNKDKRYGMQLELKGCRKTNDADLNDGFEPGNVFEVSRYPVEDSWNRILSFANEHIKDKFYRELVIALLHENAFEFKRMPAAENLHHPFTGGLIEHIRSVTRVAMGLADHYALYYRELNPPINKDLIVAGAILHDIGKLREFQYNQGGARYTPSGRLVGHIVLGRDMIRAAAVKIDGFTDEKVLLLEHVILAHHGKPEYDSPRRPMTLEAMIVHCADEIDARMNCGARALVESTEAGLFTTKVFGWENTRLYRGIPVEGSGD